MIPQHVALGCRNPRPGAEAATDSSCQSSPRLGIFPVVHGNETVSWSRIEKELDEYESRKAWPLLTILTTCGVCLFLISIGLAGPFIFLVFIPGIVLTLYFAASLGVVCPSCGAKIQYGAYGSSSKIDILRNFHQCPHCQRKFE
jgi:hypothetical protein